MFLPVGLHNTDTFVDIARDQPASGAADGHVFSDVFLHIDAYDQYTQQQRIGSGSDTDVEWLIFDDNVPDDDYLNLSPD